MPRKLLLTKEGRIYCWKVRSWEKPESCSGCEYFKGLGGAFGKGEWVMCDYTDGGLNV